MTRATRNTALLLVVLAAGLLTCTVLLVERAGEPDGGPRAVRDPGGGRVLAGAQGAAMTVSAGHREEPAPRVAAEAAVLRAEVETAVAEGPLLHVVAKDTSAPLAQARVWYVEETPARMRWKDSGSAPYVHWCELAERYGSSTSTDDGGKARLPQPERRYLVAVRHGLLFGVGTVRKSSAEVTVQLVRDEPLHLRVDGPGADVGGLPLAVYRGTKPTKGRQLWSGVTSSRGTVTVPHFQLVRGRSGRRDRFAAAFRFPTFRGAAYAGAGVEFTGMPAPTDPVVLELPATGSVVVMITDRRGAPVRGRARVSLRVVRPKDGYPDLPVTKDYDKLSVTQEQQEDAIVFPHVGLGLELEVSCRFVDDRNSWTGRKVFGPIHAGQQVVVKQSVSTALAIFAGRLLEPGGAPLEASRTPTLQVLSHGRKLALTSPKALADDGGFTLSCRVRGAVPPLELEVRATLPDGRPAGVRKTLGAVQGGVRRDLGDLKLEALAPLVRGLVVDDRGEPIAKAYVRLQRYQVRGTRPGMAWVDEKLAQLRTDGEGRFDVFGHELPGRRRVRVSASGHTTTTSPDLEPGAEVVVELPRHAALAGEVLVPSWLPKNALRMRLVAHADGRARETKLRPRSGTCKFSFGGLQPGVYDAILVLRSVSAPVTRVSGIVVPPGSKVVDARLRRLDLRGVVHRFELRTVGPDGSAVRVSTGAVVGRAPNEVGAWEDVAFRWKRGKASLIHTSPSIDLTILVSGYRPRQLHALAGSRDVVLEKLSPTILHLPGLRSLVRAAKKVRVTATHRGPSGIPSSVRAIDQWSGSSFTVGATALGKSSSAVLAADDTARLALSHSGLHEVSLRLYRDGIRGSATVKLGVVDLRVGGEAPIPVPIDEAVVRSGWAELLARVR